MGAVTRFCTWTVLAALSLAGAPAMASSVRVQISSDIRTTIPGVNAADGTTSGILLHIVEGLVAFGEEGNVKPLLADSIDASEDGLLYTFKLRSGLHFHNGNEVTANDVKWSWDYFMAEGEWRCRREFDGRGIAKVVEVKVIDPLTISFKLDKPNPMFLPTMARFDCAMAPVIDKASLNADGSWAKPIGTGPYMFAEWKKGEAVKLSRFAQYSSRDGKVDGYTGGKRPLIDDVYFTVVPDPATAIAALKSGSIDIIPYLSPSDYSGLKDNKDLHVSAAPNMGMVTLLIQNRDPLLKNVKLRQALAAAIDPDQLVAAVSDGLAKRNNSIVPSTSSYHTAAHDKGYQYDVEHAKQLLIEAGYKGELLVIQTNQRQPWSYNVAVVAQSMLQAAGVNAQLEVLEWTTQLDRYWKGNYQLSAFPYSAQLDPSFSYNGIIGNKDEQQQKIWEDKKAIDLVRSSMATGERDKRQILFDELHQLFLAEVPMLMLYNNIDLGASTKRVEGYRTWQARPRLWEVTVTD